MKRYLQTILRRLLLISVVTLFFSVFSHAEDDLQYDIVFGRKDTDFEEYVSAMNVYTLDIHSHSETLLLENVFDAYLNASPNGKLLLFGNFSVPGCNYTCVYNFVEMTITPLNSNSNLPSSIEWSPNSNSVANSTWYAETSGVYLSDLTTNTYSLFRAYDTVFYNGGLSWSPDGERLAIIWESRNFDIYDVFTRELLQRRFVGEYSIGPQSAGWSPTGSRLAVIGLGVYIIDENLEAVQILTPEQTNTVTEKSLHFLGKPQWLLDESGLIVTANTYEPGQSSAIYIIDLSTLEKRKLSEGTQPQLSPDGEWIVFIGRGELENDVYIMRTDGSDIQQMTFTDEVEIFPQWIQQH